MIDTKKSDKKKHTVSYDKKSFFINGKRMLFIGGEFHYFRTPPELWEDRLQKISRSGANLVSTYVPWNWHEPVEGKQTWTGDRDLARFIELTEKYNLYMIIKPGPYCCAELDFGGHPDWLLSKDIRLRMLDKNYLDYTEKWYRKIAEIINPHLVTNGGNIFCIQVENEYDHLIHFGDYGITREGAIAYFTRLTEYMEKYGIDIPKSANEAKFLRGTPIIDTRTYYPNIPFHHEWEWLVEPFEGNIKDAKEHQAGRPVMILELQTGWFGQYGRPFYMPGLDLTEAVSKSVLMLGASVLNYYMYAGGTTFPFWGCRGNIVGATTRDNKFYTKGPWDSFKNYPLEKGGLGVTTSFDFGGAPIREWGEVMADRYYWIKAFNRFTRDYAGLLLESDDAGDLTVTGGGNDVKLIGAASVHEDGNLSNAVNRLTYFSKKLGDQHLICLRNFKNSEERVDIGWAANGKAVIKDVVINPYGTLILPVNVAVEGTDLTILYSTSELLFRKRMNGQMVFGLYGKRERPGETALNAAASDVSVLYGSVQVEKTDQGTLLRYRHEGIHIIKVRDHILFLLDFDAALKLEDSENCILMADTYYVKDLNESGNTLSVLTEMRNGSENRFTLFAPQGLAELEIDGRDVTVSKKENLDEGLVLSEFSFKNPEDNPVACEWLGDWKVKPDTDETASDGKGWTLIKEPVPLEKLGLIEHGYTWYKAEFELPDGLTERTLVYTGNDADKQFIYVNGVLLFGGISTVTNVDMDDVARPGKNTLTILYQNFFHNKSHPHEGDMLKFSGVMTPIIVKGKKNGSPWEAKINEYHVRQSLTGVLKGYMTGDFNDKDWMSVPAGKKYIMEKELGTILWMRRRFSFSAKPGWSFALRLTIPEAEQRCILYLNGKALGWFEAVGPQHDFYIPDNWLKETNTVAVCLEGPKGFLVQPVLSTYYEAREVGIKAVFKG
ncbi:MAG: beta-galactosidase [Spirochaetales bacterium]|nr:beta-galactosidase [Spirochaetales bacterium]